MKVEVQQLFEEGRAIPRKESPARPRYRGRLSLGERRHSELGRIALTAELQSLTDSTGSSVLPPLLDAAVIYVDKRQLRIRGFETMNGLTYGQVWDIEVAEC